MTKIIAALNMTVYGNCDHTAGIPVEEIHEHYTELLSPFTQLARASRS